VSAPIDVPLFDVAPLHSVAHAPEPSPEPAPEPVKWTEALVLDALQRRYTAASQGADDGRFAFATHVRSGAGFGDNYSVRTADAVAMDLWPSKGLQLHGHEVKVSRSDWLTELKDPTKCEGVKRYMDRWWLVVPSMALVKREELPAGWGLMVLATRRISTWNSERRGYDHSTVWLPRVVVQAPKLEPIPVGRSFMAALMRATAKTAKKAEA
jgi:hypothetical protein